MQLLIAKGDAEILKRRIQFKRPSSLLIRSHTANWYDKTEFGQISKPSFCCLHLGQHLCFYWQPRYHNSNKMKTGFLLNCWNPVITCFSLAPLLRCLSNSTQASKGGSRASTGMTKLAESCFKPWWPLLTHTHTLQARTIYYTSHSLLFLRDFSDKTTTQLRWRRRSSTHKISKHAHGLMLRRFQTPMIYEQFNIFWGK